MALKYCIEHASEKVCQAIIQDEDLGVEIPKYTVNMVSEGHYTKSIK